MNKIHSKLLIVDSCVIQSAGETEHPISSACRQVLQSILEICHQAATTPDIFREWDDHISRYSRKWRRSMAARKKPIKKLLQVDIEIDLSKYSEKERAIIEKDLCLLKAAKACDNIIVTRDDNLRRTLMKTECGDKLQKQFIWFNPMSDSLVKLREF